MEKYKSPKQIEGEKDELIKDLQRKNKVMLDILENIVKEYDLEIVSGVDILKIRRVVNINNL